MAKAGRILIGACILGLGYGGVVFWSQQKLTQEPVAQQTNGAPARQHSVQEAKPKIQSPASYPALHETVDHLAVRSLADAASITSEFEQSALLYALAAPLGAEGIEKLLQEAKRELVGGDYRGASAILIGRFAELDFSAALAYALASGGAMRESWLRAIFHARARLDLADAVDQAATLNRSLRSVAGLSILRSVDHLSATERQSIVERLEIPGQMLAASQHNPVDAWRAARDISDPRQRVQTQMGVIMNWARSDPAAALEATEEISNIQMRRAMQSEVLALLAVEDTAAALNWLDSQQDGLHYDQLNMAFISRLAQQDPVLAQSLITRLPESQRGQVEVSIWSQRAGSDPEGAAAWIANLSEQNQQQRIGAAQQLLMVLSVTSQESADRFFQALPSAERTNVESTYVQMLARNHPLKAAQHLDQISDERRRTALGSSLVSNWVRNDPDGARHWIDRQPSQVTPELYHSLGVAWAHKDVSAAQEFADRQTSGADRDQFLAGIISSGRIDPDDAETMRKQISDPALRENSRKIAEMRQGVSDGSRSVIFRSGGIRPLNGAEVQHDPSTSE